MNRWRRWGKILDGSTLLIFSHILQIVNSQWLQLLKEMSNVTFVMYFYFIKASSSMIKVITIGISKLQYEI